MDLKKIQKKHSHLNRGQGQIAKHRDRGSDPNFLKAKIREHKAHPEKLQRRIPLPQPKGPKRKRYSFRESYRHPADDLKHRRGDVKPKEPWGAISERHQQAKNHNGKNLVANGIEKAPDAAHGLQVAGGKSVQ